MSNRIRSSPWRTDCCGSYQAADRNSVVRKMQVMKMRGQAPIPGLHTFRITDEGVHVFPRVIVEPEAKSRPARRRDAQPPRTALDRRQGIGRDARRRYSGRLLGAVAGPSGPARRCSPPSSSSKARAGASLASSRCSRSARARLPQDGPSGWRFDAARARTHVGIIQSRPLDLSIDEIAARDQ